MVGSDSYAPDKNWAKALIQSTSSVDSNSLRGRYFKLLAIFLRVSNFIRAVKSLRLLTSILLLLILGLSLGEEVFGDSEHVITWQGGSVPSFNSPESDAVYPQLCDKQGQENHSKCSDPCHLGQCHLGHCSFPMLQSDINLQVFEFKDSKTVFSQTMVEGPTLEGPRRPPRYA